MMMNNLQDVIRDIAKQSEDIIFAQLNQLIENKILIVESTQPVLVQEFESYKLTLRQAVKLTFRGAEVVEELKTENERLKKDLAEMSAFINKWRGCSNG